MILTVTLNAALDVTYEVERIALHQAQRVDAVSTRAGGKGINVARVLHALGRRAIVCGFVGGATGEAIHHDLAVSGLSETLHPVASNSRLTVTVVERSDGDATTFNEPGPQVSSGEWASFLDEYARLVRRASIVVLSGSLPRGVPADAYAKLAELARSHGLPTILDADGDALRLGLEGRPAIVKPNLTELRRAVANEGDSVDLRQAAELLRVRGAESVVVSLGADGLLACTDEGCWRAEPPQAVVGNPTGAGDAAVAALALGLLDGRPWPQRLREAAALSAAAVLTPLAGSIDLDSYQRFLPAVRLERVL